MINIRKLFTINKNDLIIKYNFILYGTNSRIVDKNNFNKNLPSYHINISNKLSWPNSYYKLNNYYSYSFITVPLLLYNSILKLCNPLIFFNFYNTKYNINIMPSSSHRKSLKSYNDKKNIDNTVIKIKKHNRIIKKFIKKYQFNDKIDLISLKKQRKLLKRELKKLTKFNKDVNILKFSHKTNRSLPKLKNCFLIDCIENCVSNIVDYKINLPFNLIEKFNNNNNFQMDIDDKQSLLINCSNGFKREENINNKYGKDEIKDLTVNTSNASVKKQEEHICNEDIDCCDKNYVNIDSVASNIISNVTIGDINYNILNNDAVKNDNSDCFGDNVKELNDKGKFLCF